MRQVWLGVGLLMWVGLVEASYPPVVYSVPWSRPGEYATYQSCGCGDACWVAEVKSRLTHRMLARLSSDCQQVYFRRRGGSPRVLGLTVDRFEQEDKFALIARVLRREYRATPP